MAEVAASKYAEAPLYMRSDLVSATYHRVDTTVAIGDGDENGFPVPADHWLVVSERGEPSVASDVSFRSLHVPLPGSGGLFVTRGRTCRAVTVGTRMHVEGDFESHDPQSFLAGVARIGTDGEPLSHASMPFAVQASLMTGRPGSERHVVALKALRDHATRGFVVDVGLQADVNLFDAILAGGADGVSDVEAKANASASPEGYDARDPDDVAVREDSLLGRIVEATRVHPAAFLEVRHVPSYRTETFRALGRRLLAPFMGDSPMETALVAPFPVTLAGAGRNPVEAWAREGDLLEEAPGVEIPEMPGYTTSEMRHYRRDGIDLLFFSDQSAAWCYAWPSPDVPGMRP